jgi:hypothetical protein
MNHNLDVVDLDATPACDGLDPTDEVGANRTEEILERGNRTILGIERDRRSDGE